AACRVLGHFRHAPSAAKLAERIRGDASAYVRHEAAWALGRMPASQPSMRPLAEGLQSKEPGTRLACHEALVAASGLSHAADAHDAWKAWVDSLQP
ncbi:MAG TPA: HEAT repeat domain-containing protein, partial [Planctomycetota bacterium]|nr:HEAT repeat domain-containing protein [Planctomycetota bacterium]